jgi:hypothetical protein
LLEGITFLGYGYGNVGQIWTLVFGLRHRILE